MNAGVCTVPCGVLKVPVRAREREAPLIELERALGAPQEALQAAELEARGERALVRLAKGLAALTVDLVQVHGRLGGAPATQLAGAEVHAQRLDRGVLGRELGRERLQGGGVERRRLVVALLEEVEAREVARRHGRLGVALAEHPPARLQ